MVPNLEEYRTKDIFQKHVIKDNLWLYLGKTDDIVILANGKGFSISDIEKAIICYSIVQYAIVPGKDRNKPFLILELNLEIVD